LSRIYQCDFTVRSYELDGYGHVNHVQYIRFLQEAALQAITDAGFGEEYNTKERRVWAARNTSIHYIFPLTYGNTFTVKTWIENFARGSCRRRYELFLTKDNKPVASAATDWVFLNSDDGRPVRVPAEMVEVFMGKDYQVERRLSEDFPGIPDPVCEVFSKKFPVYWRDIDIAKHLNNAAYFSYIEECGLAASAAYGWPFSRIEQEGLGIFVHRHTIEYHRPAVFGDELEISTWLSDFKRTNSIRNYLIKNAADGALLARARVQRACVDFKSGRPIAFPEAMAQDFQKNSV